MVQRILMAVLVGIVTGIVVYIIGMGVALLPGADAIGAFIMGIAWLLGLVAAIWFYLTGRNPLA